jgi:hypothetical protein
MGTRGRCGDCGNVAVMGCVSTIAIGDFWQVADQLASEKR